MINETIAQLDYTTDRSRSINANSIQSERWGISLEVNYKLTKCHAAQLPANGSQLNLNNGRSQSEHRNWNRRQRQATMKTSMKTSMKNAQTRSDQMNERNVYFGRIWTCQNGRIWLLWTMGHVTSRHPSAHAYWSPLAKQQDNKNHKQTQFSFVCLLLPRLLPHRRY